MAEEQRVIRVKIEGYEQAKRELEELKRLRDELSQPVRAQTAAAGGGLVSSATGLPLSSAGSLGASPALGSFVPRIAAPAATGGELAAASEQVVAQLANEVRASMAGAAQRFGQGLPIGGGLATSRPVISGATGVPAIPIAASPVVFQEGQAGFREIQAAAASLLAEGVTNASSEQVRQRAGQLRASAQQAALAPTGTGGRAEVMPENVTPMRARGGGGGGRGGGGRGGGAGGGGGEEPPDWFPGSASEWAEQRAAIDELMGRGRRGGMGTGGGAGGGRGRREQGPFQAATWEAFTPAMLGLTFQFGVMPLRQQLDPAIQAAEQFGAPDPARTAAAQRLQAARIRLGQQAAGAQAGWDTAAAGLLGGMADLGLGGPLQNITNIGQGIGDIATAYSPLLLAGVLGGRAFRGIGGGLMAGGRAALGAAGGAVGGLGLGGLAAGAGLFGAGAVGMAGQTALAGAAQQAAGQQFGGAGELITTILGLMTPLTAAPAISAAALRQLTGARGGGGAFAGAVASGGAARVDPFFGPQGAGGAGSPLAAIVARQQAEAARAETNPAEVAAEQEAFSRAQTRSGLIRARQGLDLADRQIARTRVNLTFQEAREQIDLGRRFDRAEEDLGTGFARRVRDVATSGARAREDLARNTGRSLREVDIGAGESVEDVNLGFRRGLQDIALSQVGGIGGAVLRLGLGRRRALSDIERNRLRARGRVGRGAADAGEDIGIGEDRALADAGTAFADAQSDLGRERGRAGQDLAEVQQFRRKQVEEEIETQRRLMVIGRAELDLRERFNNDLRLKTTDTTTLLDAFNRKLEQAGNKAADDLAKIFEGWDR